MNCSVARVSAKRVAAKLVGCQGSNPQVSQLSRFHDEVWDFSNEDQNPSDGQVNEEDTLEL